MVTTKNGTLDKAAHEPIMVEQDITAMKGLIEAKVSISVINAQKLAYISLRLLSYVGAKSLYVEKSTRPKQG
jgi:hypothetical protein